MAEAGGQVTVRVNSGALVLEQENGTELDLVQWLRPLDSPGIVGSVPARALAGGGAKVTGRVCGLLLFPGLFRGMIPRLFLRLR